MHKEQWKAVPGNPDYAVSTHGRMKRLTPSRGTHPGRIVTGARRSDGYLQIFNCPPFNLMHQAVFEHITPHTKHGGYNAGLILSERR